MFHGVNVHIVSGSGATDDNGTLRGLGNLIVDYDEDPAWSHETSRITTPRERDDAQARKARLGLNRFAVPRSDAC